MTACRTPDAPLYRAVTRLALAALTASALSACAPLLLGGAAMGTGMVVSDRRTSGTQVEDQGIELKAVGHARELFADSGHVNAVSYNRVVLLTGEVPSEADRKRMESATAGIANVRGVVNELVVAGVSSISSRTADSVLTSKVKATMFVDAKDLPANAFKVVTERGVVYLMGRVTEREAKRATDLARGVNGVLKVVKLFELVSEAELAKPA